MYHKHRFRNIGLPLCILFPHNCLALGYVWIFYNQVMGSMLKYADVHLQRVLFDI